MKINGFVTPFEKDKSGNVIQVAIEDEVLNKYVVVNDKKSNGLFKQVNREVTLSGEIVDYDSSERPIFIVKKIFPSKKRRK